MEKEGREKYHFTIMKRIFNIIAIHRGRKIAAKGCKKGETEKKNFYTNWVNYFRV